MEYLFYNNSDAVQVRGTAGYTVISWDDIRRPKGAEYLFYQNAVLDTAQLSVFQIPNIDNMQMG